MRKIFGSRLIVLLVACILMLSIAIFAGCNKDTGDPDDTSDFQSEIESESGSEDDDNEVVEDDKSYKITYNLDGASSVFSNPKTYTSKDEVILRSPKKDGFIFLGWTYDGQTEPVIEPVIPKGSKGNKTFTANWKMNEYTISFDANGGVEITDTIVLSYGMDYTLPTPTRTGYSFAGWFSDSIEYKDGKWESEKDLKLTAKWTVNKYTITYNMYGGENSNVETYTVEDEVVLKAPRRDNYDFTGWTYAGHDTPEMNVTVPKGTTGDLCFDAHWKLSQTRNLVYSLTADGEAYKVTGSNALAESITIVSTYEGKPVVEIGENAFSGFSKLSAVEIPATVHTISKNAFANCTTLSTITLPDSVRIIGQNAFIGCSKLSSITIPKKVLSIGDQAFNGCTSLATVTFAADSRLESIGNYAFRGCTSLANMVLPASLKTIGNEAFRRVAVASFTLPASVESVGEGILSGCNSLVEIKVAEGNTNYYAGGNCLITSENVLVAGCKTSVVPAGVTTIAKYAFRNIAIESIVIPQSVVTVEADAFKDCTSLADVYYVGTATDFDSVSGGDTLAGKCYYYTDTQPAEAGKYWHYVEGAPTKWELQA